MIVKICMPGNGKLSPIHITDGKELNIDLESIPDEAVQSLKGDSKGFFEASFENDTSKIVIGKRVSAQNW